MKSLRIMLYVSLFSLLVSLIGLTVDHRLIGGELAWIKPFKFSLSFSVYALTLMAFTAVLNDSSCFRRSCTFACWGAVVDLAAIIIQVWRGTASHFNEATGFDTLLYVLVRAAIVPVAAAMVVSFVILWRRPLPPVIGCAMLWGALVTVVGFIPGMIMLLPDHLQAVLTTHTFDGHCVGLPAGGPGLPFLGWSTVAGDLRVAHFVGIHAAQAVPVFALMLNRFSRLTVLRQEMLVSVFSSAYFAIVVLLTRQALRGHSVVSLDSFTLTCAVAVALTMIVGTLMILPWRSALKIEVQTQTSA